MKKHERMENWKTSGEVAGAGTEAGGEEGKNMFSFVFAIYLYYSCARPLVKFTRSRLSMYRVSGMYGRREKANKPNDRTFRIDFDSEYNQHILCTRFALPSSSIRIA